MSHSTHVGFNAPLVGETTIERLSCFPSRCLRWIEGIERLPRSRLSSACGVGNISSGSDDPDPVTEVRGTNGRRGNALPLRVIPELGQVSENGSHPASHKEAWDILHEDEGGS
jgi:hypothetical protein